MLTATRNEILDGLAIHANDVIACHVVIESTDREALRAMLREEAKEAASQAEYMARMFFVEVQA